MSVISRNATPAYVLALAFGGRSISLRLLERGPGCSTNENDGQRAADSGHRPPAEGPTQMPIKPAMV